MKKGRPAHLVSILAAREDADRLAELLLRNTTTFGVRRSVRHRTKVPRRIGELATPWGPVRIKIGDLGDFRRITPEYESCRALAERTGLPLLRIWQEVEDLIRSSEWMGAGE
jgi:uncharacterized protein (DUF111 family)